MSAWVCQIAWSKIPQRAFSFKFVPLGRHPGLIFRIHFSCYIVPGRIDWLVLMSLWVFCQNLHVHFLPPSSYFASQKYVSVVRRRTGKAGLDNPMAISFSFFLHLRVTFLGMWLAAWVGRTQASPSLPVIWINYKHSCSPPPGLCRTTHLLSSRANESTLLTTLGTGAHSSRWNLSQYQSLSECGQQSPLLTPTGRVTRVRKIFPHATLLRFVSYFLLNGDAA